MKKGREFVHSDFELWTDGLNQELVDKLIEHTFKQVDEAGASQPLLDLSALIVASGAKRPGRLPGEDEKSTRVLQRSMAAGIGVADDIVDDELLFHSLGEAFGHPSYRQLLGAEISSPALSGKPFAEKVREIVREYNGAKSNLGFAEFLNSSGIVELVEPREHFREDAILGIPLGYHLARYNYKMQQEKTVKALIEELGDGESWDRAVIDLIDSQ